MDLASRSCSNHHGPDGCRCLLLQEQHQQYQLHHPSAAHSLHPTTTPLSGSYFHDFNSNTVYSHPHGPHLPSQLQFHFAVPEQNTRESGAASNSSRKHKSSSAKNIQPRKRQRIPAVPTTEPPSLICGVGPPTAPENVSPPATPVRSLGGTGASSRSISASFHLPTHKRRPAEQSSSATDVWYFCRPQNSPTKPVEQLTPDQDQPPLTRRPRSKYVICKLCTEWYPYKNVDGVTTTIRNHLRGRHKDEFEAVVHTLKLKHSNEVPGLTLTTPSRSRAPKFDLNTWHQLLIKWIVTDDQAINVVDNARFRTWALYGRNNVADQDLPHRTKLIQMIFREYEQEYQKTLTQFKSAVGRISFTSDCWSDPNLVSFLALTAHFIARENGHLILHNRLLAFRIVEGAHDGENLARIIFTILKEAGLLGKLGEFTLDNAGNNRTLMEWLERLLREVGISFCRHGNRIHCFPHVINIAVQTILKELEDNPYDPVVQSSIIPSADLVEYAEALRTKPISNTRSIVAICRKSGSRRTELHNIIMEGIRDGTWPHLRAVQLLRDCVTRWSSTYNMIDRCIELYPAIEHFLSKPSLAEHTHQLFKHKEFQALIDIHQILQVAHMCQELLSAERCPTLSLALPIYEKLVVHWRALSETIPELAHYIRLGIGKIMQYVAMGRRSRVYALAMILNPKTKFKWIEQNWSPEEVRDAEAWMEEAMLAHRTAQRKSDQATISISRSLPAALQASSSNRASSAQTSGFARFSGLSALRRAASLPSTSRSSSNTPSASSTPLLTPIIPALVNLPQPAGTLTEQEPAFEEEQMRQRDIRAVQNALYRYKEEPLVPENELLDLVQWWDEHEMAHPLLFPVALDVLPVQASAVPCERIFSSSKETCALRRSLLSASTLEVLQVLKQLYKEENLQFVTHLLANEDDYAIDRATEAAIHELISSGNVEELWDLINNMDETRE